MFFRKCVTCKRVPTDGGQTADGEACRVFWSSPGRPCKTRCEPPECKKIADVSLPASHLSAVACAPGWKTRAFPFPPGDNVPGGARPAFTGGSNDWRGIYVPVRPVFSGEVSLRPSGRAAPAPTRRISRPVSPRCPVPDLVLLPLLPIPR